MTPVFRHRHKTARERFVLWLIARLLPDTPLAVNVRIGPDFTSLNSRTGGTVLVDRIEIDLRAFDVEATAAASRTAVARKSFSSERDVAGAACD